MSYSPSRISGCLINSWKSENRGVDAANHEFVQRAAQPHQAFVPALAVHDQLADEAVVIGWDRVAGIDGQIQTHAKPARCVEIGDLPGTRFEGEGVFRIDAALDGVAFELDVDLIEFDSTTIGDTYLIPHEVEPGDVLGHGML